MLMARKRVTQKWSTEAEIHANAIVGLVEVSEAVLGAKEVHDAICTPPLEKFHEYEIANAIVPARYVSGDFVITFESNGAKYVVLGDLMGKGLSAAMWLTHVVDLVRRACELEDGLSSMMGR